ncbi:hypothetical protein F2P81_000188 [Scophthalmus maximus]|uniref:Uncharacterized protein n=1 Tax=Scophthalmus maximus TaxID=52904 RepID=A0A6A4TML1_SCOMX|nr:hypothetical protein F2P81_000188 [Scophthalmus maximus]
MERPIAQFQMTSVMILKCTIYRGVFHSRKSLYRLFEKRNDFHFTWKLSILEESKWQTTRKSSYDAYVENRHTPLKQKWERGVSGGGSSFSCYSTPGLDPQLVRYGFAVTVTSLFIGRPGWQLGAARGKHLHQSQRAVVRGMHPGRRDVRMVLGPTSPHAHSW